ncbi:MAG: H-type lectin domain-containing protein [Paracoccaceae bacterium]|nr:H-type lectin domain-containing protein [Paracoccaceae bacterium]
MERIDGNGLGVARGSLMLFSDFEAGGAMWTGDGPRLVRRTVRFPQPFRTAPTVFVTPEMWDYDSSANIRGDLTAEGVSGESADIVFKVWADTRIARLRVAWMALGPLPHDDDWAL